MNPDTADAPDAPATRRLRSDLLFGGQHISLSRTVWFQEAGGPYTALVVAVNSDDTVDLATFGPRSVYFQHRIPYDANGARGTWRWPARF